MAVLAVEFTFPAAPITSLQKRIAKGIEQLYYTRLFLTSSAYSDGDIWRRWHGMGFHVAIFSPPPGTRASDRVRVRLRAPSRTPLVSVTGANVEALKDLESLLGVVDGNRPSVAGKSDAERAAALRDGELGRVVLQPLVDALGRLGLEASDIDDFVRMLQRGFDALTEDEITAIDVSLS
jgi:hypothetical protein